MKKYSGKYKDLFRVCDFLAFKSPQDAIKAADYMASGIDICATYQSRKASKMSPEDSKAAWLNMTLLRCVFLYLHLQPDKDKKNLFYVGKYMHSVPEYIDEGKARLPLGVLFTFDKFAETVYDQPGGDILRSQLQEVLDKGYAPNKYGSSELDVGRSYFRHRYLFFVFTGACLRGYNYGLMPEGYSISNNELAYGIVTHFSEGDEKKRIKKNFKKLSKIFENYANEKVSFDGWARNTFGMIDRASVKGEQELVTILSRFQNFIFEDSTIQHEIDLEDKNSRINRDFALLGKKPRSLFEYSKSQYLEIAKQDTAVRHKDRLTRMEWNNDYSENKYVVAAIDDVYEQTQKRFSAMTDFYLSNRDCSSCEASMIISQKYQGKDMAMDLLGAAFRVYTIRDMDKFYVCPKCGSWSLNQ